MLDIIEKLINEHGSATILREHLELLRGQIVALQLKNSDLEFENSKMKLNQIDSDEKIRVLNEEIKSLKGENKSTQFCDHCGSSNLKRTGAKPHPSLGRMGVKFELFTCINCNKESSFLITPK